MSLRAQVPLDRVLVSLSSLLARHTRLLGGLGSPVVGRRPIHNGHLARHLATLQLVDHVIVGAVRANLRILVSISLHDLLNVLLLVALGGFL